MARFYDERDAKPEILKGLTIGILGYGNQGHAHALNLRDSGHSILIGARENGQGFKNAFQDGFTPVDLSKCAARADVLMLTLPDVAMSTIWSEQILPHLAEGSCVLFAHGFNIVYDLVEIPDFVNVGIVSPKGAGAKLRSEFLAGRGLAALVAVHQDVDQRALDLILAYAHGLGSFRALVMETTPREETHTDLFGEQTVLCGGIPELLKAAFDTLVDAGYSPEAAYFECIHEAKLITDLIYARGLAGMRQAISDTASWGGLIVGPTVIGKESREAMAQALEEIQNGNFAKEWMAECQGGQPRLTELQDAESRIEAEQVGGDLRERMGLEES